MGTMGIIAAMVGVQFSDAGLNTLSKAAMNKGMSNFVFIPYSNTLAFLILVPLTFMFHRNRPCPELTLHILIRIVLQSFLSYCVQICLYAGIGYSSPTLASAMFDLVPAFTFILAILTRMEKLDLKTRSSQAKSVGTIISISGALIMTLYKGPPINLSQISNSFMLSSQQNWTLGGFLLALATFSLALLLVLQTWILKDYPAELMVTVICCFFVVLLSTIVGFLIESNSKAWTIRVDIELATIVYAAIFGVGVKSLVYAWALRKKGPFFVSMFKPISIVAAAIMGITLLGDTLGIGSVIGAVVIAVGFYSVMWGKFKEEEKNSDKKTSSQSSDPSKVPLL